MLAREVPVSIHKQDRVIPKTVSNDTSSSRVQHLALEGNTGSFYKKNPSNHTIFEGLIEDLNVRQAPWLHI